MGMMPQPGAMPPQTNPFGMQVCPASTQSFTNSGNWFHSTRHSTAELFNARSTEPRVNGGYVLYFKNKTRRKLQGELP